VPLGLVFEIELPCKFNISFGIFKEEKNRDAAMHEERWAMHRGGRAA
jgi:hypothetical protein